jgi:hypothetical protein
MYAPLLDQIRAEHENRVALAPIEPTGWDKVDRQVEEAREHIRSPKPRSYARGWASSVEKSRFPWRKPSLIAKAINRSMVLKLAKVTPSVCSRLLSRRIFPALKAKKVAGTLGRRSIWRTSRQETLVGGDEETLG